MIKIVGKAEFLTSKSESHYNIYQRNARIEPFESQRLKDLDGKPHYIIACKFEILLEEDSDCKSKNDYVGKVKPFLDSLLDSSLILNTQNYSISQVDTTLKHITDFF
ncbi:hypothetical protein FQ087_06135 [Sporosarcina sp. ANT_H38]|uniref:hypothetical protein n=1 Tax=Sporosarcina sp. ANT_H38 TaxID=2597358 RepID=UPI0011F207F5|nr:hypothetical protein [Sporosarcina sp. ANT_H38]KAA0965843.1 hypothetical protein FQ087_06135 [Sporosarcina sp. ANT_H38]